jgi:RNA polymerase-associated protein LEO1
MEFLNPYVLCLQGILQSQGRVLRKMRFMPSSLSSNSHRLLTAIVDSRHKKVYKVKNCITDIDPEREKEEKEKVISCIGSWCVLY